MMIVRPKPHCLFLTNYQARIMDVLIIYWMQAFYAIRLIQIMMSWIEAKRIRFTYNKVYGIIKRAILVTNKQIKTLYYGQQMFNY